MRLTERFDCFLTFCMFITTSR